MDSGAALMIIAFALLVFAIANFFFVRHGVRIRTARHAEVPPELRFTPEEQAAAKDALRRGVPIEDEVLARKVVGQWDELGRRLPLNLRDPFHRSRVAAYVVCGVVIVVGLAGGILVAAAFAAAFLIFMLALEAHRTRTVRRTTRWIESTEALDQVAQDS